MTNHTSLISTNSQGELIDRAYINDSVYAQMQPYLGQLIEHDLSVVSNTLIAGFVDGCKLACPMPLLKTKVALRHLPPHKSLYVIATDPHSQVDIASFCYHSGWTLLLNRSLNPIHIAQSINELENLDTIFHFIITRTDGN